MKVIFMLCALFYSAFVSATPLNNIVVFGDSLSDNGNLYEYTGHKVPVSPPYFEGHFTNGHVWVERLAESYFGEQSSSHLLDFAFGGAGISKDRFDDVLLTLDREIDSYLLAHDAESAANSLFIVWIGANNYLGLTDNPDENISMVNKGIRRGLNRLVKAGAKHILVLNLPDLGKAPVARELNMESELSYSANRHNALLAQTLTELQAKYPNVQWLSYDVNQLVNTILAEPSKYGFNNTQESCYKVTFDNTASHSLLQMAAHIKVQATVDSCDGYLFFDSVHPTAIAHQLMADTAKRLLDKAGLQLKA